MLDLFSMTDRKFLQPTFYWSLAGTVALMAGQILQAAESTAQPTRLLDRQPFDRVTLNAASGGEVIDVLLLELPNRRVPNPFPAGGSLELRRLSEPSTLYTAAWTSIARIELFEQLLLSEAVKLASARDLDQSYEYLGFLHKNYPRLDGLDAATANYLRQDAQASYAKKNYEETLTVLLSLYDLNPQQRAKTSTSPLIRSARATSSLS